MVLRCFGEAESIAEINVSGGTAWTAASCVYVRAGPAVRGLSWDNCADVAVVHEVSHPSVGWFGRVYRVVATE